MSHDAPTVSARFVYDSTTTHAGSATIHGLSRKRHGSVKISYECARFSSFHVTGETACQRYSDSPRTLKNGHDSTHGANKNEPDSATVELRFRRRPQSTTIHPECFKRFKIVVALSSRLPKSQDSPRITTVLARFMPMSLRCYYESCRCTTI